MGSTAARLVVAALLVVAATAALAPPGTAATTPSITLAVDGTVVADGESTLVETDPTLDVTVDANRSIREVSVRLDGTTIHRATPNDTTFDGSFDVAVPSGDHTVTVVVKTDGVTTHEVTITKDAERPYVRYTAPFETDRYAPPPESATVNRSLVVLAGNFTDVSGVTHLRINRTTTYDVGGLSRTDTAIYTATDLDGSFEQPIFLGVGRNNITARYYDRLGHQRVHRFPIVVEDTAPPSLSNLSLVRQSPSTLRLRGVATDNGQLQNVTVQPRNTSLRGNRSALQYLVESGGEEPDRTRQRRSFDRNLSLYTGATALLVTATDTAGNTVERVVTVQRTVAPELRLDPTGTRFESEGTVVARGGATDGEIVSATVETVDPDTGEVVDIVTVHEGDTVTDLSFERRLDAPAGRQATIRLRVIDAAGTEHVQSTDRTLTVDTPTVTPTATPAPTATPTVTPTATAAPTATATPAAPAESAGLTVPIIGITVPIPSFLGASVSILIPVVGPFDVPIAPLVGLLAVGLGVVARIR
ncbi:hypothetical protein DU500_06575 [Haloplanus rubicundus]|uniref:Uncharacterized protein n=2 Tax=Haloplanus rubicundus TaxID=1547898 RepID=A0A345E1R2_9EURY|nr:hypothetical protein DU500_06575 [Haloplanus rubicundus]